MQRLMRNLAVVTALVLVGVLRVPAEELSRFEWRSPKPFGYSLNSVVFVDGVFLAPAGNYYVAISNDGESWTLHRVRESGYGSGTGRGLIGSCWDGSQFIITSAEGEAYTSPDGQVWTYRYVPFAGMPISDVASNGAMTVVAGSRVATTIDWVNWSYVDALDGFTGVAVSDSEIIAVGGSGVMYRSTDGVMWSDVAPPAASTVHFTDVLWNGSHFLAVGSGGAAFRSTNGLVWTESNTGYSACMHRIAWDGSSYTVLTQFPEMVFSSNDGLTWSSEAVLDVPLGALNGIAYGAGKYVVVGDRGTSLSSINRSTWVTHSSGPYEHLRGVVVGDDRMVAVGDSGVTETSENGVDWTEHQLPQSDDLLDVEWTGSEFIAVGESGAMWASDSGESWTARSPSGVTVALNDVFAGTVLVAVGEAGTIVTSPDGVSWTQVSSTVTPDLHAVASNDAVYVAVGDNGVVVTSPDAVSWTERASGTSYDLRTILWDGSSFYATGKGGDLVVSSDGMTWSDGEPLFDPGGSTTYDLALFQGNYVSVTNHYNRGVMIGEDMVSWTYHTEWGPTYAVDATATGAIAVGLHGSIISIEGSWVFTDGFETGNLLRWSNY